MYTPDFLNTALHVKTRRARARSELKLFVEREWSARGPTRSLTVPTPIPTAPTFLTNALILTGLPETTLAGTTSLTRSGDRRAVNVTRLPARALPADDKLIAAMTTKTRNLLGRRSLTTSNIYFFSIFTVYLPAMNLHPSTNANTAIKTTTAARIGITYIGAFLVQSSPSREAIRAVTS